MFSDMDTWDLINKAKMLDQTNTNPEELNQALAELKQRGVTLEPPIKASPCQLHNQEVE